MIDFEKETLKSENTIYHVKSPTEVDIISMGVDKHSRRTTYASADVGVHCSQFDYGRGYSMEQFIVELQASFQLTDNRNKLINAVSRVSTKAESTIEDDGISQTVSGKAGVLLESKMELPNPIKLIPFKSFPEIEIPEESFVFRVSKNHRDYVEFKLFNSSSMAWELDCVQQIKKFLRENTSSKVI